MKLSKVILLFLTLLVLILPACSQNLTGNLGNSQDFLTLTGLSRMREALESGAEIVSVRYSNVTIGATSEFVTEDPEDMQALWEALCRIQVVSESMDDVTDWYPWIYFTLSDGSEYSVGFNSNPVYELAEDGEFWELVSSQCKKYGEGREAFLSLTGLDKMQEALNGGAEFVSVYYTDGYEYTSEFTTEDPDAMWALWNALYQIRVGAETAERLTDWYPQICFTLSDGSKYRMRFEGHCLEIGPKYYTLTGDCAFWNLTGSLVDSYPLEEAPEESFGE